MSQYKFAVVPILVGVDVSGYALDSEAVEHAEILAEEAMSAAIESHKILWSKLPSDFQAAVFELDDFNKTSAIASACPPRDSISEKRRELLIELAQNCSGDHTVDPNARIVEFDGYAEVEAWVRVDYAGTPLAHPKASDMVAAHDALSDLLENPGAGEADIRKAAADYCETMAGLVNTLVAKPELLDNLL